MRMRQLCIRPSFTLRGRTSKGLRGWSGKSLPPSLTHLPIAAYILGAIFDVISVGGRNQGWGRDFYIAGSFLFVCGAIASTMTALTGYSNFVHSTVKETQVRGTADAHAWMMSFVTMLVLINVILRLTIYRHDSHPTALLLGISIAVAVLVVVGATLGGSLVYEYGFNVETSDQDHAWQVSESDVMPGQKLANDIQMSPAEWLADSEVAITSQTPDPLAEHSS